MRYALRGFRRNPAFALTVIATLALGIGATTAVFSVVDQILFRSLPYEHADRSVSVGLVAPIIQQEFMLGGSYFDWRDARLRPGMTIEQAKAALQPLFDYSLRLAPRAFRNEVHLRVRPLRDRQMHDVHLTAWVSDLRRIGRDFDPRRVRCGGQSDRGLALRLSL